MCLRRLYAVTESIRYRLNRGGLWLLHIAVVIVLKRNEEIKKKGNSNMTMPLLTYENIAGLWQLPFSARKFFPRDWSGSLSDLLDSKSASLPAADRVWCAIQYLPEDSLRRFSLWCAHETVKMAESRHPLPCAAADAMLACAKYLESKTADAASAMAVAGTVAYNEGHREKRITDNPIWVASSYNGGTARSYDPCRELALRLCAIGAACGCTSPNARQAAMQAYRMHATASMWFGVLKHSEEQGVASKYSQMPGPSELKHMSSVEVEYYVAIEATETAFALQLDYLHSMLR